MGLLLSVMVVCVGVLELLACIHHARVGFLPLRDRRYRSNSLDLLMEYFLSPIKDEDFPEQQYDNTTATTSASQELDADTESVTPTNEDSKSQELTPDLIEYRQENIGVECSTSSVQSESVIESFASRGRSTTDKEHDESSEDAPIFKDVTRKELAIQRRRSYRRRPVSSTSSDGSDRASIRQEQHHRLHRPPKAHSFEETTVEDYLQRQKHLDQDRIKPNSEPETKIGQLTETMGAGQTRQTTAVAKNNNSNEIPFRSSSPELTTSPISPEKINSSSPTPSSPQAAESTITTTKLMKYEEPPSPKTLSPISTPEPDEHVTSEASENELKNQEPFWVRADEAAPKDVDRPMPPNTTPSL